MPETDALEAAIQQAQNGLREQVNRPEHRQVDPQIVIQHYRQRCADLEFENVKVMALLEQQDRQIAELRTRLTNAEAELEER